MDVACLFLEHKDIKTTPSWAVNSKHPVYSKKGLCVVSKYPFLWQLRLFLRQIYRISISNAPVPIEKYISNFCGEVPLPPRGIIEVNISVADVSVTLSRPPPNTLPQIGKHCLEILFARLNVDSVILVWRLLLMEVKVIMGTKTRSILTPVMDALLKLLFPFYWAGVYIPVLPPSLMDVIDAPVPYFVGISNYKTFQSILHNPRRPADTCFVDLDTGDLYYDALNEKPQLPQHDGVKLIKQLSALNIDIATNNEEEQKNNQQHYYRGSAADSIGRPCSVLLHPHDFLFPDWEPLKPVEIFALEDGTIEHIDNHRSSIDADGKNVIRRSRVFSDNLGLTKVDMRSKRSCSNTNSTNENRTSSNLSDTVVEFPDLQVRLAFLRFMTAFFEDYEKYVIHDTKTFNEEAFVKSLDKIDRPFALVLLRTQLWDGFVRDRTEGVGKDGASSRTDIGYCIQFFKESIYKKMNRSIKLRTKFKTKFLDSSEFNHRNTFHAPLPMPAPQADGTMSRFSYVNGFPRLIHRNYGFVRKPRRIADYETQRRANAAVQQILMQLHLTNGFGLDAPDDDEDKDGALSLSPLDQIVLLNNKNAVDKKRQMSVDDINANEFKKREKSIVYAQSLWRCKINRRNYQLKIASIRTIQTNWGRMKRRTPLIRKRNACKQIQRLARQFLFKLRRLNASIKIVSVQRMYVQRCQYLQRRRNIIKRQAIFRGYLIRKESIITRYEKIVKLREELFKLWKHLDKPLLYRAKFWLLFGSTNTTVPFKQPALKQAPIYYYTFLEMGVHLDEVERLKKEKERCNNNNNINSSNNNTAEGLNMEAKTRLHNQNKFKQFISKRKAGYEKHDRDHVYERLKLKVPKETRQRYFNMFKLDSGKRRKHQLAERLFMKLDECDLSSQVMLSTVEQDDIGVDWVLNKKLQRINKNIYETLKGTLQILGGGN